MMVKVYLILQNIVIWLAVHSIVHLQGLRFPLQSINFVNTRIHLTPHIGPMQNKFFCYLKGIADYGLLYTMGDLQLSVFCDSDWVGDPDD